MSQPLFHSQHQLQGADDGDDDTVWLAMSSQNTNREALSQKKLQQKHKEAQQDSLHRHRLHHLLSQVVDDFDSTSADEADNDNDNDNDDDGDKDGDTDNSGTTRLGTTAALPTHSAMPFCTPTTPVRNTKRGLTAAPAVPTRKPLARWTASPRRSILCQRHISCPDDDDDDDDDNEEEGEDESDCGVELTQSLLHFVPQIHTVSEGELSDASELNNNHHHHHRKNNLQSDTSTLHHPVPSAHGLARTQRLAHAHAHTHTQPRPCTLATHRIARATARQNSSDGNELAQPAVLSGRSPLRAMTAKATPARIACSECNPNNSPSKGFVSTGGGRIVAPVCDACLPVSPAFRERARVQKAPSQKPAYFACKRRAYESLNRLFQLNDQFTLATNHQSHLSTSSNINNGSRSSRLQNHRRDRYALARDADGLSPCKKPKRTIMAPRVLAILP